MASTGEHTATCRCGSFIVTARGEPAHVYACSCVECQRGSGSVFSYAAIYPEQAVTIVGAPSVFRRRGDFGRLIESSFCPTCGTTVCFRAEAMPGMIGVAVGCFADPDFAKPERLFWASRRHRWLDLGEGIALLETQPD
jgi:hypothetical protein